MKKIAVIGAGIYGCTIALKLSEAGYEVDLIEKENDIMKIALFISRRAHMGYFYPRSDATIISCQKNAPALESFYPGSILKDTANYYAIAKENSQTSALQFLEILDRHKLPYKKTSNSLLDSKMVDLVLEVEEHAYNPTKLRGIAREKLKKSKVNLLLNTDARNHSFEKYDLKIVAAYANGNEVTSILTGNVADKYEYRLCEKIVAKLPESFRKQSFVIMDGPFFQLEPFEEGENNFVISNFLHSVHAKDFGDGLEMNQAMKNLLGKDLVRNPSLTNFSKIIEAVSIFIPTVREAKHVGSIFAIKALIPDVREDSRPSIVKEVRKDILSVFSGKVSGSIQAAEECLEYARKMV